MTTSPSHGRVLCLELSWKRSALHGTTMFRLSWRGGRRTAKSAHRRTPPLAMPAKATRMSPPSLVFAYVIERPRNSTLRSTCSGMANDPGRATAIALTDCRLSKSVNDAWQNAA
jgi:hypothetical protein